MNKSVDLKQWQLYLAIVLMLLSIFSPVAAMITWKADIENSVKKVSEDLDAHKIDPDVHMRLKEKIEFFVTRSEWAGGKQEIKEDLKIIREDIKKILSVVK